MTTVSHAIDETFRTIADLLNGRTLQVADGAPVSYDRRFYMSTALEMAALLSRGPLPSPSISDDDGELPVVARNTSWRLQDSDHGSEWSGDIVRALARMTDMDPAEIMRGITARWTAYRGDDVAHEEAKQALLRYTLAL
jgi:hypothetical protein